MCAANETWRARSVQCCTFSNRVHVRYTFLSSFDFNVFLSSHSCNWFSCCICNFPECSGSTNTGSSPWPSNMYTTTTYSNHCIQQPTPPSLGPKALPHLTRLQIFYHLSSCHQPLAYSSSHPPPLLAILPRPLVPFHFLTR